MTRIARTLGVFAVVATVTSAEPVLARSNGHYLVFFDQFSANVSPSAKDIISRAATDAIRRQPNVIRIEARANAAGSADATMKIAQTRAAVVRDMLVADGVSAAILQIVPIG